MRTNNVFYSATCTSRTGGTRQIFIWGASPLGSNPYTFIYHFLQERYPFRIPSIDNGSPSTYLVWNFASLLTAVNVLSLK